MDNSTQSRNHAVALIDQAIEQAYQHGCSQDVKEYIAKIQELENTIKKMLYHAQDAHDDLCVVLNRVSVGICDIDDVIGYISHARDTLQSTPNIRKTYP